jgi:hypothetical protein
MSCRSVIHFGYQINARSGLHGFNTYQRLIQCAMCGERGAYTDNLVTDNLQEGERCTCAVGRITFLQ